MDKIDFRELRDQWALKHTPSKEYIQMQADIDQRANPHNEPYHNKQPRREAAQIVSDVCYSFADQVLKQQYGRTYTDWLIANTTEDHFTRVNKYKDSVTR